MAEHPHLDVTPTWANLNQSLIRLVDHVPEDRINWSPKPELWNFRGILLHIADARDNWLGSTVRDGTEWTAVWHKVRSKPEIQEAFRRTWTRLERFLSDPALLDATYDTVDAGEPPDMKPGHWIAFHLLEHDIHHRADILHYLALLGIETPDVGTP
ncbi:MAG: DinB family protein [Dehalococcoidia bacterium]